jgi:hypothetical protein
MLRVTAGVDEAPIDAPGRRGRIGGRMIHPINAA